MRTICDSTCAFHMSSTDLQVPAYNWLFSSILKVLKIFSELTVRLLTYFKSAQDKKTFTPKLSTLNCSLHINDYNCNNANLLRLNAYLERCVANIVVIHSVVASPYDSALGGFRVDFEIRLIRIIKHNFFVFLCSFSS